MAEGSHIKRTITAFKNKAVKFSDDLLGAVKNSDLARSVAGTSDKRTKEYKAAMRNVQRWKKGTQKPSVKSREKVEKGVREDKELSNKLAAQGGATLTVKAKDKDDDYYLRDRELELAFSEDMLRQFLDKADESISDAMDYFFQSVGWDWSPPIEEMLLTISGD